MVGILAALLLLTAATLALPTSKHSWTETPWDGGLAEEGGTKATTLSLPLAFNLSGAETPSLYIGGHVLNLSEYLPCQFSCQLWIRKGTQWSHYLEAARGEEVDVILYMPRYGNVDLYLISYASGTQDHWNFKLLEGYHLLRLTIEEEGRHFMMAAQKNEPGNSLVLDVVSRADTATTSPLDLSLVPIGKAKVTVKSERMRGYDVYLNGVFYSSDIGDGSIDGIAIFTVCGDKTHTRNCIHKGHSGQYHQRKRAYQIFKRDVPIPC